MTQGSSARPVVVGVDGSSAALAGARFALEEARARSAPLLVVTAVSWPYDGVAVLPPQTDVAAPLATITGARAHRVFPGRLDKSRLDVGERAMVTAMRAPLGDFRNWDEITAWAADIAGAVTGLSVTAGVPDDPGLDVLT